MNSLRFLLSFLFITQLTSAFVLAQYLVEVLETSFGSQHPVMRIEASGASFGGSVLDFSFGPKAVGCAVFADPINACGPVKLKPPNDTSMYCDTYFAVVARGNCSFSEKAYAVQIAQPIGFDAMIVYNDMNKGGPSPMSGSTHSDDVKIPLVMITYSSMKQMMNQLSMHRGYTVTIKASPGYYDLIKYLVPFVVIVAFCFLILFISLVIRLCRERRRLAKKRLSRANLKKLPVKKYQKGDGSETCAICLEDFVEGEKVRVLPCRHCKKLEQFNQSFALVYHTKCVDQWLTKNRKVCPICKRKVGPSNGSDSDDSDAERNTVSTSVATTSRDSDPLLTNVSQAASRASILNIRWLPYATAQPGPSTAPPSVPLPNASTLTNALPNNSALANALPTENEENRRSTVRRMGSAIHRTFSSLRRKFARTDTHRRLENDDTLSSIILDSDIENAANVNGGYASSSHGGDGTSLTTVVDVEPVPADQHE